LYACMCVYVKIWIQITPEECLAIANQANGLPGSVLGEHATPVVLCGAKYMVLRADDNVFYIRQVMFLTGWVILWNIFCAVRLMTVAFLARSEDVLSRC